MECLSFGNHNEILRSCEEKKTMKNWKDRILTVNPYAVIALFLLDRFILAIRRECIV